MGRKKKIQTEPQVEKPVVRNRRRVIPEEPAKQSLIELQQQDGRVYNKRGVRTLDELTGERQSLYSQRTEEEYVEYLDNLNLTDLQEHASKHQVMPKEDRRALIATLVKQYKMKTSPYFNSVERPVVFQKKITAQTEKILSEGR